MPVGDPSISASRGTLIKAEEDHIKNPERSRLLGTQAMTLIWSINWQQQHEEPGLGRRLRAPRNPRPPPRVSEDSPDDHWMLTV
ncbi:hypothetical protein GB937_001744 [Aspergillus fischeri]|nr:hypothetical protein GB937_001744 [Aspergillus fischeri]